MRARVSPAVSKRRRSITKAIRTSADGSTVKTVTPQDGEHVGNGRATPQLLADQQGRAKASVHATRVQAVEGIELADLTSPSALWLPPRRAAVKAAAQLKSGLPPDEGAAAGSTPPITPLRVSVGGVAAAAASGQLLNGKAVAAKKKRVRSLKKLQEDVPCSRCLPIAEVLRQLKVGRVSHAVW